MTDERNNAGGPAGRGRGPALTRGMFLRLAAGAAVGAALPAGASAFAAPGRMPTRPIPSSGTPLPIVGLGTWITFDVGPGPAERAPLADVLRALFDAGGSVVDTAPMYDPAEDVIGDLLATMDGRDRAFLATKVLTTGRESGEAEMRESLAKLRARRVELMQVHNLVDWRTQLPTLRAWKEEGRVGHVGVTHYTSSAFDELEAVMRAEPLDFVQLNYAIDDRAAEERLLPLASDRGIAVIVNQPFRHRALIDAAAGRPLPPPAAELGCKSWAQVFLKFVLAHPAVTCVIPGTGDPAHMAENARAALGPTPDPATRERLASAWASA